MSETQKLGGWFNGPVEVKTDAEQVVGRQAVVIGLDPTTIAIDALRAAITSRNGQLTAISGQMGKLQQDFDQWPIWRNEVEEKLTAIQNWLGAIELKLPYPIEQKVKGLQAKQPSRAARRAKKA